MDKRILKEYRDFLKEGIRQKVDFTKTDQSLGVPPPPMEKPLKEGQEAIDLCKKKEWQSIEPKDLIKG